MRRHVRLLVLAAMPLLLRAQEAFPETATLKLFERRSVLLSAFWGRDISVGAAVVLPPDAKADEMLPVCWSIHGFGGSHRNAIRMAPQIVTAMQRGGLPRMLYVYLDAQWSLGHHEFADSVNNGPWGAALTREFVPALEQQFHAFGAPA